jgi:hypothetical protein
MVTRPVSEFARFYCSAGFLKILCLLRHPSGLNSRYSNTSLTACSTKMCRIYRRRSIDFIIILQSPEVIEINRIAEDQRIRIRVFPCIYASFVIRLPFTYSNGIGCQYTDLPDIEQHRAADVYSVMLRLYVSFFL